MASPASIVELLGESPGMVALRAQVGHLLLREASARRLPPILIQGETGTGKGLLARAIHRGSSRSAAPFIDINCAAIPETLLEAELFGFERGAFTDARQAKPGLFQAAHRGVVFLDEIGLLPEVLQGKLLKVIEERVVRRLGSVHDEPTDIWIIAATSTDLPAATRARRFREDLYHRLATLTLRLPPLRERGADAILLAEHFLARACRDYRLPPKRLDPGARQALLGYGWPGNVRELANVMERVALLGDERAVTASALGVPGAGPAVAAADIPVAEPPLRQAVDDIERRRLVQSLHDTAGNVSRAAARLGMPRSSLRYRLEKHGLQPPGAPTPSGEGRRSIRGAPATAPPVSTTATMPTPAGSTPGPPASTTAAAAGVWPVEWQSRHLAFLRVVLRAAGGVDGRRAQPLLRTLLGKVQAFGGRLEEQGPDGFLAAFGVEPIEDAATRAAHAALAVQRAVQRDAGADPGIAVVAALHAATALAGATAAGVVIDMDARHQARRLLEEVTAHATGGEILVSAITGPRLERRFHLAPVAGLTGALRVLAAEVTGYGLAGRPLSPFVGRAGEMALLDSVCARVRTGHGQVVALVGEPGVGKSRIMYEVARRARADGWLVLEGHGASYGTSTPYLPLLDLLRRHFRLEDTDGPDATRDKIAGRLAHLPDAERSALWPALDALIGAAESDAWARLESPERREQILDGVKRLLLRESQAQPLIVLLEDLHWIDGETQAVLDRLVESLPASRLLLLVSYRPEYRHGWGTRTYSRQLQIDPLPPESAEALLDGLLGSDTALATIKRLVVEQTEGNPFFMEESVRSLVETGLLAGERGAYHPTRDAETVQVPATVEAMLAARIDRLPPEDRRLLQVAAVVGKDVGVALLRAVADLPDAALEEGLDRLQAGEFVYETGLPPDVTYRFRHALTHDVAYAGVSPADRHVLHGRIVAAIEALSADRLDEHVERLAHHALHGALAAPAIRYLRRAGLRAVGRAAPGDARRRFEQALDLLRTLPETRSTLEQALAIRLELRPVLQLLGEGRAMLERLHEAEALAERLHDDHRRGQLCALATNAHCRLGEFEEALAAGARALEIAGRLDDAPLRILTTSFLAQTQYYRGDHERAVQLAAENLQRVTGVDERHGNSVPASVYDRATLVKSLVELGRFADAAHYEAEALAIAEATGHALTVAAARWAAVTHRLIAEDWAQARIRIDEAIAVARTGSLVFLLPFAVAASAWALAEAGDVDHASSRLRDGHAMVEGLASSEPANLTWVYHALGRAALRLGRLEEAQDLGDRALATARTQRGQAAWAYELLGEIASDPARPPAARGEAHYREALALATPRGMRPLLARCHRELGRLYRRLERRDDARQELARAIRLYRTLGMTSCLARARHDAAALA